MEVYQYDVLQEPESRGTLLKDHKDDCAKGGRHVMKKVGPHVCTLYPES